MDSRRNEAYSGLIRCVGEFSGKQKLISKLQEDKGKASERENKGAKIEEGLPVEAAGNACQLQMGNCQLDKDDEREGEYRKEGRLLIVQSTLPKKASNSKVCQLECVCARNRSNC